MKKVFIAGTFDPFHVGHQWFLAQANELGERVSVIVATDAMVRQIRGRDPFDSQENRLARVSAEGFGHHNVRFGREDGDFLQTLREEAPDILLLGFDQHANEEVIAAEFPDLEIRRASAFYPEFFKSTKFR